MLLEHLRLGKITDEMKEIYEIVKISQENGIECIKNTLRFYGY